MKKTLLLGSFAIFGLMANAQYLTEITEETISQLELSNDKDFAKAIEVGKVVATGDAGTLSIPFEDTWITQKPAGDYSNVKVGDVELVLSLGISGQTNPTFDYLNKGFTAGAAFCITPAKDGWVTVFTKISPNKEYAVMEGETGPMSYTLGYANSNGTTKIYYTIPYDEDYYIDFNAPDIYDYIVANDTKPLTPQVTAGLADNPGNGTGFLTFNVLGGNKYYFGALGSKAACGGFVLTEGDEEPTVTFMAKVDEETGETIRPEVVFAPGEGGSDAGVGSIEAAADVNAPVYNVMGQKVNDDYNGIVINNGKKFIRK